MTSILTDFSQTKNYFTRPRSHSPPDPSSHKRPINRRRHSLPSKFHHNDPIYHPYFSRQAHHYTMSDDSIDTTLSNQGIIFYQDPNSGEVDFYWDDESEICSPSLMPENTDVLSFDEISGDSTDIEEKYFKIMAEELSKRRVTVENNNINDVNDINEGNVDIDMDEQDDDVDDMNDMIKEMNELLSETNQELKEQEQQQGEQQGEQQEEPPSPTSPSDPEREGPVLSEEEEDTEEGALHRLEHDPEFQDEAGLMYGEGSEGRINPDDEGMDPMENM